MILPDGESSNPVPVFDDAAYRTENLDDPDLVAAYEIENEAVRLDRETIGAAWVLGLIPLALVLALLSALLGDWIWRLLPAIFIAVGVGLPLMSLGRRFQSNLPLHLPGYGVFTGSAKKRLILKAAAFGGLVLLVYNLSGPIQLWIQRWVEEWLANGVWPF
ncbi:hypothetical protein [Altererythrobacter sp. Root672]|uniref:hypothetical protein n=1 Tax=Altererythrobacter sp. Root672 TaxID=1736584 RepID=UPI0006FDBA8F|nr:hypothetical protein [Altererythrobacter sp. Root672]KRA83017.1 hypothetical protein ASD76_02730 [Altererythrobacter sp. Root672]